MPSTPATQRNASGTAWSLIALASALALGALGARTGGSAFTALNDVAKPIGSLWVNALQLTVIPVILTQLLAAMVGTDDRAHMGALGARSLLLFIAMLVGASLFAVLVTPAVLAFYPTDAAAAKAIQAATTVPEALRTVTAASGELSWEWLGGVLPSNLFLAASRGDILPLLLFTIVFGAAASRLPAAERNPIARTVHSLAAAMLTVIRWLLVFTPVGVFALAYGIALATGLKAAGMVGAFIVAVSVPMLLGTLLLYPVASIFGRVSLRAFARAVAPAQLVAVSSRSSIASLPALVDGAKRHLHLGDAATGFVLPLAVSTFKVNRTISATIKVLFLAHVFGTTVPAGKLVVFIVTVIILSFTALGVPGGGSAFKTLPAYLAAGVPIEGVIVLEAVDTIPDIFKTLLNVTGDMAAAVILGRPRAAAGSAALGVTGATAS